MSLETTIKTTIAHGLSQAEVTVEEARHLAFNKLQSAASFVEDEMHDHAIKLATEAKALLHSIVEHLHPKA